MQYSRLLSTLNSLTLDGIVPLLVPVITLVSEPSSHTLRNIEITGCISFVNL